MTEDDPFLHDPGLFERSPAAAQAAENVEKRLAELVAYHTGLFTGQATCIDADPAWIAHALWTLAREAEKQRERWLVSANRR